jgi:serine/threonine-protein kinase RsbW
MMAGDQSSTVVRLAIPARSRYLRLARLTAAGIASDLGFSLQAIEDLRVAIDEVCALLIDGCPDGVELELSYEPAGDKLLIEGTCACGEGQGIDIHPVARELLEMTADEYDVATTTDTRRFRLVKHREEAPV